MRLISECDEKGNFTPFVCNVCKRDFQSGAGLCQHNSTAHAKGKTRYVRTG